MTFFSFTTTFLKLLNPPTWNPMDIPNTNLKIRNMNLVANLKQDSQLRNSTNWRRQIKMKIKTRVLDLNNLSSLMTLACRRPFKATWFKLRDLCSKYWQHKQYNCHNNVDDTTATVKKQIIQSCIWTVVFD